MVPSFASPRPPLSLPASAPPGPPAPHQLLPQPTSAPLPPDPSHPIGITPNLTHSSSHSLTLPTVLISHLDPISHSSRSVKARIDRNVPLDQVIRQLCNSAQLAVREPCENYALRDSVNNELITPDNLDRKIESGSLSLKLVKSSKLQANDLLHRLKALDLAADAHKVKLYLFSLKDFLRETEFLDAFLEKGGDHQLVKLSQFATGNTLAYALSALQVLGERSGFAQLSQCWETSLTDRLTNLLGSAAPINVLRPTSAILRSLVARNPQPLGRATFSSLLSAIDSAKPDGDLLSLLASRIGLSASSDYSLAQVSLSLVNVLTRVIVNEEDQDDRLVRFFERLDRANMRKAVLKLSEGRAEQAFDEVEFDVLAFQKNLEISNRRLLAITVTSEDPDHVEQLMTMADRARDLDQRHNLAQENLQQRVGDVELEARKWKTLGFDSENLLDDFEKVGFLGLRLMYWFMSNHVAEFDRMISEQLAKPDTRRCPYAKASNKCVEILAEIFHWNLAVGQVDHQMSMYRPLELNYHKLHELALEFFYVMWNESGATTQDYERVGVLVRSQMRSVVRCHESSKLPFKVRWANLVKEFENVEYVRVRDRQMQELALEDDLWNKPPVQNLRRKLYQEAFEFVKTQRIHTLLQGSWFPHRNDPVPNSQQPSHGAFGTKLVGSLRAHQSMSQPARSAQAMVTWRFYRLAPNRKYLHYLESSHSVPVKNGVDDMPDRIDVSLITDIVSGSNTGGNASGSSSDLAGADPHQNPRVNRRLSALSTSSTAESGFQVDPPPESTSKMLSGEGGRSSVGGGEAAGASISLMSGDHLLVRLYPPNAHIHSEWLDGLNMVKVGRESGVMSTKLSAELVYGLTQVGTMVQLLDLSGDRVEVPRYLGVPPLPAHCDFFYTEGDING